MTIQILPTLTELSHLTAELIVQRATASIAAHGTFTLALSGGSTPRLLYHLLATDYRDSIAWEQVHIYWSDERCVPPNSDDSCYKLAKDLLLDHVPIPSEQIYRMEGEADPTETAQRYESVLQARVGVEPQLDLILLGMGGDGHTASLFPNTTALNAQTRWVVANHVEKVPPWRLTMTFRTLNNARTVVILAAGADKLVRYHEAQLPASMLPVARVQPTHGELIWMLAETTE